MLPIVHTTTITHLLSEIDYQMLKGRDDFHYYKKQYHYTDDNYTWHLKDYGVTHIVLYTIKHTRYMSIRLNLKRLADNTCTKVDLFQLTDLDKLIEHFSFLMYFFRLPEKYYSLSSWNVTRLDYCVNINTQYVTQYLHLLRKSNTRVYHNTQDYKDSCYITGKSTTLNAYDKKAEILSDIQSGKYPDVNIHLADDLLRVEIQIKAPKIQYLLRNKESPNNLFYFLNYSLMEDMYLSTFNELRAKMPYQKQKKVSKKIDDSDHSISIKSEMKTLVKFCSKQHSTIAKAKDRLIHDGWSKDKVYRRIRSVENLGVCCVTIPRDFAIDELDSVYNLCLEEIQKEKKSFYDCKSIEADKFIA